MGESLVVEEVAENQVVVDKGASEEGLAEVLDGYGVVVELEFLVDVDFFLFDLLESSLFFSEDSKFEHSIV